jgi:glycosyltransferase involved in cell wall biosynthesis
MDRYDNAYAEDNVYGHVVGLVAKFRLNSGEIFLDFGCGYGRIAEVLRDRFDVQYIGLDINERGLVSLKQRGFSTMFVDLSDADAALTLIDENLPSNRRIGALCIIDTLEHVADPVKALVLFHKLASRFNSPLIVSVPNVAHRDICFKSAVGKFDYTPSGLLDYTHLQYFTETRVNELMQSCGWHEVHKHDVSMHRSDQHFPAEMATLSSLAPLHRLLACVRSQVDTFGFINQFVRAYLPGGLPIEIPSVPHLHVAASKSPFLSVVTRTQGRRIETLRETLLCLSAQTCQDFDVYVVGHNLDLDRQLAVERVIADLHESIRERVRLVRVDGGTRAGPLNAGFGAALGDYVAFLDDDDLVFGHWVENFYELAKMNNGQLLRQVAVAQHWDKVIVGTGGSASRATGGIEALYPEEFDFIAHIAENRSPLHSLAFPRSLFRDLGYRFDDKLTTSEDWDFIIRVAQVAGVAVSKNIGCIYRQWKHSETSFTEHDQFEWQANYFYTLRKIDNMPLLLPLNSASHIRAMYLEIARLRPDGRLPTFDAPALPFSENIGPVTEYLELLRGHYHALVNSTSWRVTAPLRNVIKVLRHQRKEMAPKIWLCSVEDLERLIKGIEASTSWRVTRPLRALRRLSR